MCFFLFLNPWVGISACLGAVAATLLAHALRVSKALIKTGLFSLNGSLVGLILGPYVGNNIMMLLITVAGAALAGFILYVLLIQLSFKRGLPVLTVPFVISSWVVLLALHYLDAETTPKLIFLFDWATRFESAIADKLSTNLSLFFRSLSWIFFQDSVILGITAFIILLLHSRIMGFFAQAGFLVSMAVISLIQVFTGVESGVEVWAVFNSIFIAMMLGGLFVTLTVQAAMLALTAAAIGTAITVFIHTPLTAQGLPVLNFPANFVTLLVLGIIGGSIVKAHKFGLNPVPLVNVSSPEKSVRLPKIFSKDKEIKLALPFWGVWCVAQGNHGNLTHWGKGSYAWDFVVLDSNGKSSKGIGRLAEDYYCFGLPVIAPAPGVVVKVEDSVFDNIPPDINAEQNWGNHVIIQHGPNLYSELSHFRYKGIAVKVGQSVVQGDLLGNTGNSGRSMEPHLHYQLQKTITLGSTTVPTKFSDYFKYDDGLGTLIKKGVPNLGDFVSNVVQIPGSQV
ncbi:MAG: hypothetical protein EXR59_04510 [Dehalococcoidia bacterium]|nr:hypothetical protein [Dehalococcoidia bacterium]